MSPESSSEFNFLEIIELYPHLTVGGQETQMHVLNDLLQERGVSKKTVVREILTLTAGEVRISAIQRIFGKEVAQQILEDHVLSRRMTEIKDDYAI